MGIGIIFGLFGSLSCGSWGDFVRDYEADCLQKFFICLMWLVLLIVAGDILARLEYNLFQYYVRFTINILSLILIENVSYHTVFNNLLQIILNCLKINQLAF